MYIAPETRDFRVPKWSSKWSTFPQEKRKGQELQVITQQKLIWALNYEYKRLKLIYKKQIFLNPLTPKDAFRRHN